MLVVWFCLQNMSHCKVVLPVDIQPTIPVSYSLIFTCFMYDLIAYVNEGHLLGFHLGLAQRNPNVDTLYPWEGYKSLVGS